MILAVKLKNAIKKEAANNNMELDFSLKTSLSMVKKEAVLDLYET